MRISFLFVLLTALFFSSCSDEQLIDKANPSTTTIEQREIVSRTEINRTAISFMETKNEFNWSDVDAFTVWSALELSDNSVSLGYKPADLNSIDRNIHQINIEDATWKNTKIAIQNRILALENEISEDILTLEDIVISESETLPYFQVKVKNIKTIEEMRSLETVRYIEPASYSAEIVDQRSDSGCGLSPDYSIETDDYTNMAPGSKAAWALDYANVKQAWNTSTGQGITVGLIDTGVSYNQDKLGSKFNDGYSSGRTIERRSTHYSGSWWWKSLDSPNDQCGHGTQMAGLIAAPRSNEGNSIGVAYNCNLVAFRGTTDVIINGGSEKDGVSDALVYLGNRSDVKVISMSIGDVFSSGQVKDAVRYAYNRGKMVMAAAGTSLSWTSWYGVIFPANMNETVAITGVRDSGGSPFKRCNTCHDGSKVDFVYVMQRNSDTDRTSLTLALSGNTPSRVSGSSCATASTAGIAALIWATNPNQSRSQVLQRMKNASSLYPSRDGNFGWGTIDAAAAVVN